MGVKRGEEETITEVYEKERFSSIIEVPLGCGREEKMTDNENEEV